MLKGIRKYVMVFLLLTAILIGESSTGIQGYDKEKGVEWGDRVTVSFRGYIDGKLKSVYTETNPLEVAIDEDITNYNFIKELVGMKKGETKAIISWYVTQTNGTVNFIEYKDVTIIEVTLDSTPDNNGPSAGNVLLSTLKIILWVGLGVIVLYEGFIIYKKLITKKCAQCKKNNATKKCAKCGALYCTDCSTRGCTECKSKTFIRLK
ncbi:MAG: hypothetical protein ACTSQE_04665 [Candidatus Heimdallarchaeaceae archaeon]